MTSGTHHTLRRYRKSGGNPCIEVRVKSAHQLFDARDPAPFRDRDLDHDFVEYVMACAKEFPSAQSFKILIHIDEPENANLSKGSVREAIHSYLSYRIDIKRGEFKSFFRRAQLYLLIGALALFLSIGAAQSIAVSNSPGWLGILREGIVIFGWVSLWKPIELLLFDWYPMYEDLRLHRKLLETEIDFVFGSRDNPAQSNG